MALDSVCVSQSIQKCYRTEKCSQKQNSKAEIKNESENKTQKIQTTK